MNILISGEYNAFQDGFNSAGIYCISGLAPSHTFEHPYYWGSAVDLRKRITYEHLPELKNNVHDNKPLQNYYNNYGGSQNIVVLLIETCPRENTFEREQYYLDTIQPFARLRNGFNIAENAFGGGRTPTEETRLRISKSLTGKKHNEERIKNNSEGHKGQIPWMKGRTHSDETIANFAKHYVFLNPQKESVEIFNLTKFCRENNLSASHMISVYKGKRKSHKGWQAI